MTIFVSSQVPAESSGIILKNVACENDVYIGAAVRMLPTGVARNAIATSFEESNFIGIVFAKPTSTTCSIRVTGVTDAIFTGLDVTKEYFLSDTVAGLITTTVPNSANRIRLIVGQPFSETQFLVNKRERTKRK